jgi:hypothetical protein
MRGVGIVSGIGSLGEISGSAMVKMPWATTDGRASPLLFAQTERYWNSSSLPIVFCGRAF